MKSKKSRKKWLLSLMAVMGIFLAGVYAVACGGEKQAEKLRDLEFAVIGPDETPQELAQIIEEKKNDSFRLTYTSRGLTSQYGKQEIAAHRGCNLFLRQIRKRVQQTLPLKRDKE